MTLQAGLTSSLALPQPPAASDAFLFSNLTQAALDFQAGGLAVIRRALSAEGLAYFLREVSGLVSGAMRKDFLMPQTDYSPRHLSVVGGAIMNQHHGIMSLYKDPWLLTKLRELTGLKACLCEDPIENVISTCLTNPGDTHGWHTDDYPLAVITCLEAPESDAGGHVELRREADRVEEIHMQPGDLYVLRSDKVTHRVAPLLRASRRTILNFTYTLEGLEITPNGTAPLICGDATLAAANR